VVTIIGDEYRGLSEKVAVTAARKATRVPVEGLPVDGVRSDIERSHYLSIDTENDPQIRFDDDRVNGCSEPRGEFMDPMSFQPAVEWIIFEDSPRPADPLLLPGLQIVEMFPKGLDDPKLHALRLGGGWVNAVSMSTVRP
jgi:hypothetical protein